MKFKVIKGIILKDLKELRGEKMALFWIFIFPLMWITLFGTMWGVRAHRLLWMLELFTQTKVLHLQPMI